MWDVDSSGTLDVDELQSMLLAAGVGPRDRLPTAEEREAARAEVERLVTRVHGCNASSARRWLGLLEPHARTARSPAPGATATPPSLDERARASLAACQGEPRAVTLAQFSRVRRDPRLSLGRVRVRMRRRTRERPH